MTEKSTGQRAFASKLARVHASDARRIAASAYGVTRTEVPYGLTVTPLISSYEVVDPVDFEEFVVQRKSTAFEHGWNSLQNFIDFQPDDVELKDIPKNDGFANIPPFVDCDMQKISHRVKDFIGAYASDYLVVVRKFEQYSSAEIYKREKAERSALLSGLPRQVFETDCDVLDELSHRSSCCSSHSDSTNTSTACTDGWEMIPRDNWISSTAEINQVVGNNLFSEVTQRKSAADMDAQNDRLREQNRHSTIFSLYPLQNEEEVVEIRNIPPIPSQPPVSRLLVSVLSLKMEFEFEPIFGSMCLFDAEKRKRVSENFYFDYNSESIRQMVRKHIPYVDTSTMCKAAIFRVSQPTSDLFLVIRLEKVLQPGDITEAIDPYVKEEKNKDKLRANYMEYCDRLGCYRRPFAWSAVDLSKVIFGASSLERSIPGFPSNHGGMYGIDGAHASDSESLVSTGTLERNSLRSFKKNSTNQSQFSRSSVVRHSGRSEELVDFDSFKPLTVTVNNFFKQEDEKLTDDDLVKYLHEVRKPSSLIKKLRCIGGVMKIDISPCPNDTENVLSPELLPMDPYDAAKAPVYKEILEFPLREMYSPNLFYRNIMYIYPKMVNFSSRTGVSRNIAVKIQLIYGQNKALQCLYGKSCCPEFQNCAYTSVNYHNRNPRFHDEIKIKLPADLSDAHHILFTFYHISCRNKFGSESCNPETVIGYSWLPLYINEQLPNGDIGLPISLEVLPPSYYYLSPEVNLPNIKWLDNHRPCFFLSIKTATTVHTEDTYLDKFFDLFHNITNGSRPVNDAEMQTIIRNLTKAKPEPLVKFLYVILDKLVTLMILKPLRNCQIVSAGQVCFEMLAQLVKIITLLVDTCCDQHGRSVLLTAFVRYSRLFSRNIDSKFECSKAAKVNSLCEVRSGSPAESRAPRSPSHVDLIDIIRGFEQASSFRVASEADTFQGTLPANSKLLHEELVIHWLSKSMAEYLAVSRRLYLPRKMRFSNQFTDDIITLVTGIISEIMLRCGKDFRIAQNINCSLAFFIRDMFSLMNRTYVFQLVRLYCREVMNKVLHAAEAAQLLSLKLDFLRIISSHEHFVTLNLPLASAPFPVAPSLMVDVAVANAVPTAQPPSPSSSSVSSRSSIGSAALSTTTTGSGVGAAELTTEFRSLHFLCGLLLTDIAVALETNNSFLHSKAVNILRNLLSCHDADPRLSAKVIKAKIAALYFPFLGIVLDSVAQLHDPYCGRLKNDYPFPADSKQIFNYSGEQAFSRNTAMQLIATGNAGLCSRSTVSDESSGLHSSRIPLTYDVTRNMLACFCWILKNSDAQAVRNWLYELSAIRIVQLLDVLQLCVSCFEYKSTVSERESYMKTKDVSATPSKSCDDLVVDSNAALDTIHRVRSGNVLEHGMIAGPVGSFLNASVASGVKRDQRTQRLSTITFCEIKNDSVLQGNLCSEINMTVLDMLENVSRVALTSEILVSSGSGSCILNLVMRVTLHMLSCNQSLQVLRSLFASQRCFVEKYPELLFEEETEQCADLCLQILRHCAFRLEQIRAEASVSFYLLLRKAFETGLNFARVKLQVTVSLSSLVGKAGDGKWFNEENLRRSLKTVLIYAAEDSTDTVFAEQVKDLMFNLHMILSDTVKMKEFQHDFEMLTDLMYRIAKGYQTSPDLRLTWLESLAQKHIEREHFAEAAMCFVHNAALAAEYMHMLFDCPYLPVGAVSFLKISENVLEESAASDDVVIPGEEGMCESRYFTELGLCVLLEQAAELFGQAQMFEAMFQSYKILLPVFEEQRDFQQISRIYGKLSEALSKVDNRTSSSDKRIFGTYFRVGLYGPKFGDLDGLEFIYRERPITKLPEISHRLESFYVERFGQDSVEIIKDSNNVDRSSLSPDKAYLQITYVEPYFDLWELRHRVTNFERNFNINRFVYATPFTLDGRAHGDLKDQFKRKTVLVTNNSFPYVKTRVLVVCKEQFVLTPIEVAIEDIRKKTEELALATCQDPPDAKILQMVLQGCIGTTVNQGPLEIANVFLRDAATRDSAVTPALQHKLRLSFKDFSKKCSDALRVNRKLISSNQREYQSELERNYLRFTEQLAPMLMSSTSAATAQKHQLSPQLHPK